MRSAPGTRRSAGAGNSDPRLFDWLRGRAPLALVAAAVALLANVYYQARHAGNVGLDNEWVIKAADVFNHGKPPYEEERFLYLPPGVLAGVPWLWFSLKTRLDLLPFVGIAFVLIGWLLSLRIFGVSARSRLAVLGAIALCFLEPFTNVVQIGNWTSGYVMALPAVLLLAANRRWTAAAVVFGVAISIKPILAPVVLVFLMARQFKALAVAVVVPAVIAVAAGAMMPQPTLFLTKTLPYLLGGQGGFAAPFDASVSNVLHRLGLPEGVAGAAGLAAAAVMIVLAWLRWRRGGHEGLRLVETSAMLMLAAFLGTKPSFDHYTLIVLVPMAAAVVAPGAASRSPWFWIGYVPMVNGLTLPFVSAWNTYNYRVLGTNLVSAATLASRAAGRRPAGPAPAGAAPGPRPERQRTSSAV
ncbi:glycosyltransferase family 87 protein [Streptomyces sp. NPDC127110]|uniref:glycosyltransferase family 87 protein n=1 Tax=Streptomyces sp. NPDC127110 TaxID=3345362 RepID=UPI0036255A52